jgi:hypothetical protein
MATTTNYSWTTPDDTDLVKDGAAAIRTLGTAIDTTVFTNAGNAIAKTIVDAKGDIIAATAADTVSRLAVGANNTVLTADSAEATGLKWVAAIVPSDPKLTPEQSTAYLSNKGTSAAGNSGALTTNRTYYYPIFVPTGSFDRIAMRSNSYSTTGNCRLGLYNASTTTGKPTTVAFDAGTVSVTSDNTFEITITQNISAGWYYFAINRQSGDFRFEARSGENNFFNPLIATMTASIIAGYTEDSVTGAYATAGTLSTNTQGNIPTLGLRIV